jgi:methyl coenzyme M reductase alpha subunit
LQRFSSTFSSVHTHTHTYIYTGWGESERRRDTAEAADRAERIKRAGGNRRAKDVDYIPYRSNTT